MVIAQSTHTDVICAFSIESPWRPHKLLNFHSPFKYQMNQQLIWLPELHVETREERKKKTPHFRKMLHSKYGFIHHWIWSRFTMLLQVIESEVNSPCFWVLPEVQNRSSIPEGFWVFRENGRYQFGPVSIHSYTQWHQSFFPLVLWVPASID